MFDGSRNCAGLNQDLCRGALETYAILRTDVVDSSEYAVISLVIFNPYRFGDYVCAINIGVTQLIMNSDFL